jgi:hypothetical protein
MGMRARLEDECIPSLVADAVGEVAADVTGIYSILVGEMAVGEEKRQPRGYRSTSWKYDCRIRDPDSDIEQNVAHQESGSVVLQRRFRGCPRSIGAQFSS